MEPLSYDALDGWAADDHAAALRTFSRSCASTATGDRIRAEEWAALCQAAESATDARAFFEAAFTPVLVTDGTDALFTGYYEPELLGSRSRTERFRFPLYRRPPEVEGRDTPWLTREEIERGGLSGRGLELAWLEDPVEAFFLHVQGSGRLALTDGSVMRVGYAGRNGHPYRSVGRYMGEEGLLPSHNLSAAAIRNWVRENGQRGLDVLNVNPSYIFFHEVEGLTADDGPVGAMSLPVTARRTVAVDRDAVPLGLPVWVETETANGPFKRLMVAQDVGAAVKGAQRADIFFGSGEAAFAVASRQRAGGRMVVLMPRAALAGR